MTPSADTKAPQAVCAALSLASPLILLGMYLFLSTEWGGRWFDKYSLRNYGSGIVTFALLLLVVAAIMIFGVAMGLWALRRRERPRWLASLALALNSLILLFAFGMLL